MLDLELTIDPGGIFGTMIFLYLMVCSIQKKLLQDVWAFRSYGPLKYVTTSLPFSVYLTLKHPCIKLFK